MPRPQTERRNPMSSPRPWTPTPWKIRLRPNGTRQIVGSDRKAIATIGYMNTRTREERIANAEYIIHAANSLPALEARVRELEEGLRDCLRCLEEAEGGSFRGNTLSAARSLLSIQKEGRK
jgi:hypothetical protein